MPQRTAADGTVTWVPGHSRASPSDTSIRLFWVIPAAYVRYLRTLRLRPVLFGLFLLASIHFLVFSGRLSFSNSPAQILGTARFSREDTSKVWERVTDGRVVVAGGGGSIGKNLVRRLLASSTPVTVLDKAFHPNDLQEIYSELPLARNLLNVKIADIRDVDALTEIVTRDVVGVIHLAAVSQRSCLEDEVECVDVNQNGTDAVFQALGGLNRRDRGRRWFVLASSRDLYATEDIFLTDEAEATTHANAYGASKFHAEKALETYVDSLKREASAGALYATSIRLPNVYGDASDDIERMIPAIVTKSLSHQVIQAFVGQQKLDLLHIDDCVHAFILTIKRLTERRQKRFFGTPATYYETFDVSSGSEVSFTDVIDKAVRFSRSKSPIQYIPQKDTVVSNVAKAPRLPGFETTVPIDEGLLRLTQDYLRRQEKALADELQSRCSQPPRPVSNDDLMKLNDCTVHILIDIEGSLEVLTNKDQGAFMYKNKFPPDLLKTYVRRRESDGKVLIRILGNAKDSGRDSRWLAVQMPLKNGGVFVEEMPGPQAKWPVGNDTLVDWEVETNVEQGTVRLLLADTPYQLRGPAMGGGGFRLVSRDEDIWPFRITPVCCKAPLPWPFYEDDPIDFMTEYQKFSTERPFLASPGKALCSRLKEARTKVKRDLATLTMETLQESRREETSIPRKWVNADLAPCSNLCSLPTVCIDTGDCQCVTSSCPPTSTLHTAAPSIAKSAGIPPPVKPVAEMEVSPLVDMVERSSWRSVLRPQGLAIIDTGVLPRVHVGPLAPSDQIWRQNDTFGKDIHRLAKKDCFSADASMELALSFMNVSATESDYTFLPNYQGRPRQNEVYTRTYNHNLDATPHFDPYRTITPFTWDWGICMYFEWQIWSVRKRKGHGVEKSEPFTRYTTAWSTMGDLNGPCYRPAQDVVIPPRACSTRELYESFGDVSHVRPARDRHVLVTFKGQKWGTGSLVRQKITCDRFDETRLSNLPGRSLVTSHPLSTVWNNYGGRPSYIAMLNDTIFCISAAGVAGWAPRLIDAIYAGCIPIVIGHVTQYPFYDMIDWGKISVRIETSEVHRIEEILMSRYTLEDVERLQANLMLIRDAFMYPLDDETPENVLEWMIDRRGPLFYALHSTRMRMLTKWPMDVVYDRP
ncbi:hypothetical protein FRB93_009836 [Tulasnella sp. JGI-2019a]|nr:hypothetical protein FRB93_009836 [Tulasnella sp. JGI-2019a]